MRPFSDGLTLAHLPSSKARRRRGDGEIDIRLVALGHIGDHGAGGGVVHLEGLARGGTDHLAVDQHFRRAAEEIRRMAQSRIEFDHVHRFPPLLAGDGACQGATAAPVLLYPITHSAVAATSGVASPAHSFTLG
jgi:hypothetical protein